MKLFFKQRFFSWFDSYDIYDENGATVFTVRGQLAWGHKLVVYDSYNNEIAMLRERIISFLPKYEIYIGGSQVGTIVKRFTLLRPKFDIDCNGWSVTGNYFEWDYEILKGVQQIAVINKQLFNFTDTYTVNVFDPNDALMALMVVLAIDAVKCSRD